MSTSDQNSPPTRTGPKVFISYRRRSDTAYARLLRQDLAKEFGDEAVFRDVERIGGGEKFLPKIYAALGGCNTFLVLISPEWLEAAGRLREPGDFVRMEIAAALASGVRVLPVLLNGAQMPSKKELPDDIEEFASYQAVELRDSRWEDDVRHLIETIRAPFAETTTTPVEMTTTRTSSLTDFFRTRLGKAALAVLLVGAVAAFILWRQIKFDPAAAAPRIDGVTFDPAGDCAQNEECFWTVPEGGTVVRTGTISGAYLSGGDVTVSASNLSIGINKIAEASNDGALRFSLMPAESVPKGTHLRFTVTKLNRSSAVRLHSEQWAYLVEYQSSSRPPPPSPTPATMPMPLTKCLRDLLPEGRWVGINYGDPDERVVIRKEQPKGDHAGILLTRNGQEVGAIKFRFIRWGKDEAGNDSGYYEIEQVVGADCRPVEGFSPPPGGDAIGQRNYDWLDLTLGGRHYDLRIAYANDTIHAYFGPKPS